MGVSVSKSRLVNVIVVLRLLIKSIIVMRKQKFFLECLVVMGRLALIVVLMILPLEL